MIPDPVLTEEEEDLLIGTGLPGADRRRYLRAQALIEYESAPEPPAKPAAGSGACGHAELGPGDR